MLRRELCTEYCHCTRLTKTAEAVHEKTDASARRTDHFSQSFLTDRRYDRQRLAFFTKIRQQQKQSRQPVFRWS